MNFLRLLFIILLATFFNTSPAPCQENLQFGYVNVADAVMLHPLMKDFDPVSRRFKLSALKTDQTARTAQNAKKAAEELKSVQSQIKKINNQKIKLENTHIENLKKLARTKNSGSETSGNFLKEYNEEKAKVDSAFFSESGKLNEELQKLQAKVVQLNKEAEYAGHASLEETSQVFSLILDDIYEGIEGVAKFYKIPFVFNSSFEFARTMSKMITPNPMPDFFGSLNEKLNQEEGKLTLGASLNAWLNNRNDNLVNCDDRRLSSFVLKGGLNMTPAVIDYIYQKHDVSKDHRDFIQDYFKKAVSN